eukprot:TRINITY_DN13629_c0_g1_i1.p1 TRINITY_DN13629_c0_g1~~TRINITY_DN13629_c0_g1_i1.p1  ORF type:complete len:399 (-),score=93.85 TRINITY_DN13629_c0_g1_i1:729-1754(-)
MIDDAMNEAAIYEAMQAAQEAKALKRSGSAVVADYGQSSLPPRKARPNLKGYATEVDDFSASGKSTLKQSAESAGLKQSSGALKLSSGALKSSGALINQSGSVESMENSIPRVNATSKAPSPSRSPQTSPVSPTTNVSRAYPPMTRPGPPVGPKPKIDVKTLCEMILTSSATPMQVFVSEEESKFDGSEAYYNDPSAEYAEEYYEEAVDESREGVTLTTGEFEATDFWNSEKASAFRATPIDESKSTEVIPQSPPVEEVSPKTTASNVTSEMLLGVKLKMVSEKDKHDSSSPLMRLTGASTRRGNPLEDAIRETLNKYRDAMRTSMMSQDGDDTSWNSHYQ